MIELLPFPVAKSSEGTFCFERQLAIAYAPVRLLCYSLAQATYLAEAMWDQSQANKWRTFCITAIASGKTRVVKDYLSK